MSTLNGQNNEHDQELLHAIEQIVQWEANTTHVPHSPLGVGARLASTVPQPDAAFADRLEARLVAVAEQRKEASMKMIASQHPPTDRRVSTSNKRRTPHAIMRIAAVCSTALVLLVGLVAATPPARAAVENFMQRFGLVLVDPAAPTPLPAEGVAEPSMSSQAMVPQKLDFEEAQRRTPFPILLPTWLPPGVEMTALDADDGSWACPPQEGCGNLELPAGVVAMYKKPGDTWSGITLQATKITSQNYGGYVVDPAAVQDATVNGVPAAYVDRSYEEQDGQANIVREVDGHMLSWEQDGVTYVLQADNLGLTRDQVIRIAESLR
jgi:hypothetical protein